MRDLLGGGEDHLARVRILLQDAIDPELDREKLRIGDLPGRDEPGPHRARAIEHLLPDPVIFEWRLEGDVRSRRQIARREIVADRVEGDVIERFLERHVASLCTDDATELRFPIELLARELDLIAGRNDTPRRLQKMPWLQA